MNEAEQAAQHFRDTFDKIRNEISKLIVGQREIIEHVLTAAVCGGHVLLEGVPGLGKTSLVHALAGALHLKFQRIQFTPDLLPADIVGTQVLAAGESGRALRFQPGPVFCNVLLADEINRATPKTQSALLETMQEKTVTVAGQTHPLPAPFFALATQNPIEHDGTYPLPEAQLDRFFFKLFIEVPPHDEWMSILDRTTGASAPDVSAVAGAGDLLRMGETARQVPADREIQAWLVRVTRATHAADEHATPKVKRCIRHGASPRAAQAILAAARVRALLDGRYHVAREDVRAVARPALRHRMILSFEGEADGVRTDDVIADVLASVAA
jgi:MoxR-like ATPase